MALVATKVWPEPIPLTDTKKVQLFSIAFDATYPSGGEAATFAGFEQVDAIVPSHGFQGYVPEWDKANAKLKLMYGDYNNAADGPLIENATADVSAITAGVALVIGA